MYYRPYWKYFRMDGVFMKKILRRILICMLVAAVFWGGSLFADRKRLETGLIRFHVVANSDTEQDQAIKRNVRDVVLNSMHSDLEKLKNIREARAYLQESLPKLQILVDQTLEELGFTGGSLVTLCREPFDIRHYDTFSLPAGVYEPLRIVIGEGRGHNWWCVSFPALCLPATSSGFQTEAVGAGFSETLTKTLSGDEDYEIRFFFLNQLGKLENLFFREEITPCHLDGFCDIM